MPATTDSRDQIVVALIVAAAHLLILNVWLARSAGQAYPVDEMSVQVIVQSDIVQAAVRREVVKEELVPKESPEPTEPKRSEPETEPPLADASAQAATANAPVVNPDATELADVEPDYRASYLNNPHPPYPMAARRMGLQGKVVLNVEVLEIGECGRVSVFQSSGHGVLDNAALQAVKTWRFVPARQAGRSVARWFKIPINFSLRNNEA